MSEQQQQQPLFGIEKIYLKDMSLEIPHAPEIFLEREAPQVDVNVHNEAKGMSQEGLLNQAARALAELDELSLLNVGRNK